MSETSLRSGAGVRQNEHAKVSRAQWALLAALIIALLAAQIRQPYPDIAPLQHIPTVVALAASPWLLRRWPISDGSLACVVAFLLLHTLGGRYTYSNLPYDDWTASLFGTSISAQFGWSRNHYDRLVHFAFGLLAVRPVVQVLTRHSGVTRRVAMYLALECVMATSAAYEVFEWVLTVVAASPLAGDYNGQQGDAWDSQKDMALAFAGALVTLAGAVARSTMKSFTRTT